MRFAVSFKADSGETVALVGPTGSGKSTIVRLVYRLYDPLCGHIKLNGQDLPTLKQKSIRGVMAMVPQDVVLFNDTIEYNIRCSDTHHCRSLVESMHEFKLSPMHAHPYLQRASLSCNNCRLEFL